SDLGDETRLLGERYEHGRRHQSSRRMIPTQEGFDGGDPPVARIDDRLVFRSQLSAAGGFVQVALQAGELRTSIPFAKVDDLMSGTTLAFRLVHRRIGVFEETLGQLIAPAGKRDADAR